MICKRSQRPLGLGVSDLLVSKSGSLWSLSWGPVGPRVRDPHKLSGCTNVLSYDILYVLILNVKLNFHQLSKP